MGVLDAFMSTWSNARATFGAGTPQDGAAFDGSSTLRRLQEHVGAAAPGQQWTGSAANAYAAVNSEHGRVLGALADLDRRLREQVDQSARLVSTGRESLDATRRWVTDAAATVPRTAAGERMLVPVVARGVAEVIDTVTRSNGDLAAVGARIAALGEEYRALGIQKFGGGPADTPGDRQPEPENKYEKALRDAGLLDQAPTGYYREWLENAERQGVPPETIVDIARRHNITPASFDVLDKMEKVTDKDGKSFFLMPPDTSGEDARTAALMTYVLNAGTDYGDNPETDFTPEPYNADEVQRIIDRQGANAWSYAQDVAFVHSNGGRLMTTPNGMLMGLGGNQLQDTFSEAGGSTWGDIFMLNIDDPADPAQQLRQVAESGNTWYPADGGNGREGRLDLDRLLHHEERHSRQWADKGYGTMLREYGWEILREKVFGTSNRLEEDAGLSDGGYH